MRHSKEFFSAVIICVFLILALGSINGDDPVTDKESTRTEDGTAVDEAEIEERTETLADLELLEHSYQEEEFMSYIVGRIRNNSDKDYGYVQIEINLYDAEGTLLDSTLDNINNLRAGETWAFKAMVIFPEDVDSYRIEGITGF